MVIADVNRENQVKKTKELCIIISATFLKVYNYLE